jgi:N-acetylmuramoyl-L-alanine amidase
MSIKNYIKKAAKIMLFLPIIYTLNTKDANAPKIKDKPLKDPRKIIILDPGHGMGNRVEGWMDWGKTYSKYKEAEIVLEKSKKIKSMLDSTKYNVILTRKDNETPCPIESRPEIANRMNGDLFLSLHINDFKNWKSISGSEIYWRYEKDKDLANLAAKNLKEIANIQNRHVSWGEYLMLKEIQCPAALMDVGYLLNEQDRNKILNTDSVEKAVVKTIEDYLK